MNFSESLITALDSIAANKLRSVLTMLGVIIGVAAVIALLAIGNGVSASITDEISSIGTNLITVFPDGENSQGYAPLSVGDVDALSDPLNAPDLLAVSASVGGNLPVVYGRESVQSSINGVTANHFEVNNLNEYQLGDGLNENDIDSNARVAVLGATVALDLFGEVEFPVGKSVKINGVSYEVVGVLEESGGGFGDSTNDSVFIPISTAQSRLFTTRTRTGERAVNTITAQAISEERTDAAQEQITEILRERHDIVFAEDDDFILFSQSDLLATFDAITATLTTFLGSIAAISLLVGGIGIMNIMLVSVTERTREIGIRKAIGALKRDILIQFLLESMVLSLLGGLLGLALGWGITQIAALALDFNVVIDSATIALAIGFSAGVGLIFGIYPAWRAAGLRPIEALRYE